jgi:CRISPR system Cascade subunit CasE
MYLTRFRVNTARREARRLLSSPNRLHGAVNMAFAEPPKNEGDGPRVLWRLDQDHPSRTNLFIVSPSRPDLTHLVEQAGWPAAETPGWTTFAYQEFLEALAEGDVWAFRLTANPVHYVRNKDGAPPKRTAHVTPRHQMRWLLERQEQAGFEIVCKPPEKRLTEHGDMYELVVHGRRPLQFSRRSEDGGRGDVRFTRVTFDGRLKITDLARFQRTLTHGIGKAKAYGCGLMTLAPVPVR